jgi:hypothetical protein
MAKKKKTIPEIEEALSPDALRLAKKLLKRTEDLFDAQDEVREHPEARPIRGYLRAYYDSEPNREKTRKKQDEITRAYKEKLRIEREKKKGRR